MGIGRTELIGGGGGSKRLKFLPGVGLGGGVKFVIYFLGGRGGGPGNLETPLATPLVRVTNCLYKQFKEC